MKHTPTTVVEAYNAGKKDGLHIAGGYPRELSDHWGNCQPFNISQAYFRGLRAGQAAGTPPEPATTTRADQYNVWTFEGACEASVIRYTDHKRVNLRGSRAARFMYELDDLPRGEAYADALHTLCVRLFAEAAA